MTVKFGSRGRAARVALSALSVLLALAVAATPAIGARTHSFLGTVGAGELGAAAGLAVDQTDGDLYVADASSGSVVRFDASGGPAEFGSLGSNQIAGFGFQAGSASQVAVSPAGPSAGDFYVAANGVVSAYAPDGEPAPFSFVGPGVSGNTLTGAAGNPFPGANVSGVYVDSNGAIYVIDGTYFDVYAPSGEYLAQYGAFGGLSIAVDSAGRVYVANEFSAPHRYDPTEYPVTASTSWNESSIFAVESIPTGLGVDPATDHFFDVNKGEVTELSAAPENEPVTAFGASRLTAASGIAVDRSGGAADGDVYVADGSRVVRFGPLVKAPDVVTEAAAPVDSATAGATLNGTVDPLGEPVEECAFEYGLGGAFDQTAPCLESKAAIGVGNAPVHVHADLAGLAVGNYRFRLRAAGPEGSLEGAVRSFSISGAPAIVAETVDPDPTGATLGASVDTGNAVTTYRFEYGPTSAYGSSTVAGTTPAATSPTAVSISVAGLAPGTTYHFRAVASNFLATVGGPDRTFTTPLVGGGPACPNEALRTGLSALLSDCRAYEMVSPVDKQGGDVYEEGNSQAAADGHGIAYLSINPFADAVAKPLISTYLGSRDAGGWSTHSADAPQYNGGSLIEIDTGAYDADLDKALVVSREALAPGAIEHGSNLYLRDFATGAYTLIAAVPGERAFFNWTQGQRVFAGGSADFSRVIVKSEAIKLQGEGVESFTGVNLYSFSGGHLELISTLPNGEPVSAQVKPGRNFVSTDGRRVYFLGQIESGRGLFLHEAGKATVPVSAYEGTEVFSEVAVADADGGLAYFVAAEGLTSSSQPSGPATLYRFDAGTGAVTEITPTSNPNGARLDSIYGTSADGSYVYFSATGSLGGAPEPPTPTGQANVYVWHQGEIRLIGTTETGLSEANGPLDGTVSPNGRFFAFPSRSLLTPDAVGGGCIEPLAGTPTNCGEVFEYSYATGGLECASCAGGPSGGASVASSGSKALFSEYTPHALFDDGSLYFDTDKAIAPRDSNGKTDVYEWSHGQATLISSGSGEGASLFSDAWAEPGGGPVRDVYFRTDQGLVGQDTDGRVDLYDARIDGGLASQSPGAPAPPCSGEAFRGPSPSPPGVTSTAGDGRCEAALARARSASRRATALSRRLHHAKGRQKKRLRRRVATARRQAKKANRTSTTCRRQGR